MVKIGESLDPVTGSYDLIMVLSLKDLYLSFMVLYYFLGDLICPKFTNITYT